jgi:hypothetical protein
MNRQGRASERAERVFELIQKKMRNWVVWVHACGEMEKTNCSLGFGLKENMFSKK